MTAPRDQLIVIVRRHRDRFGAELFPKFIDEVECRRVGGIGRRDHAHGAVKQICPGIAWPGLGASGHRVAPDEVCPGTGNHRRQFSHQLPLGTSHIGDHRPVFQVLQPAFGQAGHAGHRRAEDNQVCIGNCFRFVQRHLVSHAKCLAFTHTLRPPNEGGHALGQAALLRSKTKRTAKEPGSDDCEFVQ